MNDLSSTVRFEAEDRAIRPIATSAATVLALLGIAERGPIGTPTFSTSFPEWEKQHGNITADNPDVVEAVRGYFDNGGQQLLFARVVHTSVVGDPTTKTSAKGTVTLQTPTTSPTAGSVTSAVQPYNLEPGQTLVISVDGGGDQTKTFTATAASRESAAENFALANNDTLIFAIDGGSPLTKTFLSSEFVAIGAATAEEVVASLNAFLAANGAGAAASVTSGGTKVTITSNRRGTGSGVNVSGGTANAGKLAFTTGNTAGTGNVSNIDAVTAAEVVTVIGVLTGGVAAVVAGAVKLTSNSSGASSSVQVKSASTADTGTGFDNAVHSGSDGTPVDTLTVEGKTDGAYANELTIQVTAASSGEADFFNLYVLRSGVIRERWLNLTMDDADERYVETVLNDALTGSDLITVADLDAAGDQRPANDTSDAMTGGDDGLGSLADTDFSGGATSSGRTGLRVFDTRDADLLAVPGHATSAIQNAMVTYCEITREGLIWPLFGSPANLSSSQIVDYVVNTAGLFNLSELGSFYWPRVKVSNPSKTLFGTSPTITVDPVGAVAGMIVRTDNSKIGGQFEQPAGTEVGVLRNVLGVENEDVFDKSHRDIVFPKNINPISKEGGPIFVDGARNLKINGSWPSVGQRRGRMFVEKQVKPGLSFLRHQNLRDKYYREGYDAVTAFLVILARENCFASTDPARAFFVDFGPGLNPASVKATRTARARIGLALAFPGEFIVISIGPDTRALDEELAAVLAA